MDQPATDLPGRAAALAEVAAALARARDGRRSVLLVEGEAGVGKTTLVRAALRGPGLVVVAATGDEGEADLDHGIIEQLVRAAPLADHERTGLLDAVAGDPVEVGAALVRLVDGIELDPARPLVVVVDDAQLADEPSLRALTFAARRLRRDPVLLCLALRPDGLARLPSGLRRLVEDEGRHVVLDPLDGPAVRQVAEEVLGRPVSAAAAARLRDHTRGNPLHLRTLLDELPADTLVGSEELPAPRSFGTLVLGRLAGAGPDVEALVAAVAVLGDPVPVAVAAEVAGVADPGPAIDRAAVQDLLVATEHPGVGRELAVAHPLVRAAVLQDLPLGRRAALHRRAGEVVTGPAGLRHRLQGTLRADRELFAEAVAAARRESDRGAHGSAAGLLRAAAGVAPDEPARNEVLLWQVDELLLAGRLGDVAALRPTVEALPPTARRRYVEGRLAYVLGPRRSVLEHLTAAWSLLGLPESEVSADDALGEEERPLACRVAAMLATASVDRADGPAAIEWSRRALAVDPERAALASAGHMLAAGWALTGRLDEGLAELDAWCVEVARRRGDTAGPAVVDAHTSRGLLRLWSHDLAGAAADLEAALAAAAGSGSFVARESARAYLAEVRYRQGRWDEAVLLADLSSSLVDDTDQVWMAALPHATVARPRAARGEPVDHHLDRARAAAEAVGGGVAVGLTWVAVLDVAVVRRDWGAARVAGDALAAVRQPVDERIAPWRAGYVEALVAEGRLDDAAAMATELQAEVDRARTPLVAADAARAAVVVADGHGDHLAADAAAEAALAEDPDGAGPYHRARLELAAGRVWRRRGERRRAAEVLRAAAARFAALGARPWSEQTEREIAALGLRPVRGGARAGAQLTPQEQAVAHLVARGLTNREVAAELVVSAKTVEHHLSRVYAKLGIRSRTELARTLPPEA